MTTTTQKTEAEIIRMGTRAGWASARRFVTGTRADRRAVAAKFAATRWSDSAFWQAHHAAFEGHMIQAADMIKAGTLPRAIRPTRIYAVLNRTA